MSSDGDNVQPAHGVRVELDLETHDGPTAVYNARLLLPDARHTLTVSIAADATVTLTAQDAAPPQPLHDLLHRMARKLAKDTIGATPIAWPRRVRRWRDVETR